MRQISPLISTEHTWQEQLRNVITTPAELLAALGLNAQDVAFSQLASDDFPLKVPHSFVSRMEPNNADDPLLLQVLAASAETLTIPGYYRDPVGEVGPANPRPGIIHKYHGRVLLVVSSGCAINCRYCFRRHFPYSENQNSRREWGDALQYIRSDRSIKEVILSGGDPLVATDELLAQLVEQIADVGHVKRLRIHSRLPIVIPGRVTAPLIDAITNSTLQTIMVVHCNHANEVDDNVRRAVAQLRRADITVLNQAVLLKGVNDSVSAQVDLSEALFAAGVLPYYLHLLDKVQGAAHFDLPQEQAQVLLKAMAAHLPGYMVPKLVREIAGEDAKTGVSAFEQLPPDSL